MATDPLTGIKIALRNQISKELYDYADRYHGFVSLLMALDNMYGVSTRFTRDTDTTGSEIQVDFRASLPTVEGASPVTGSLGSLELPTQSNFSVVGGKMPWSHYQLREDVRKAYIEHLEKNPKSVVPYVKEVSAACRDAVIKKLEGHMIPDTAVATSGTGNASESQVLAVPYPLQAATSGTYNYLDLNLAAAGYTDLQATVKTSFGVMSLSNLRTYILLPLRHKRARIDVALCDSAVYDYILGQAEMKVVIEQNKQLNYGGEYIRYGGLIWIPLYQLDQLATNASDRSAYFLDSETWCFIQRGVRDDVAMTQHPNTAWLMTMLGKFTCALVNKIPRRNGRATSVTLS